jgi:hypothetical protein
MILDDVLGVPAEAQVVTLPVKELRTLLKAIGAQYGTGGGRPRPEDAGQDEVGARSHIPAVGLLSQTAGDGARRAGCPQYCS